MVYSVMNEKQQKEFEETRSASSPSMPRAWVVSASVHSFSGTRGMVLRRIESRIPTLEELRLPPVLRDLP